MRLASLIVTPLTLAACVRDPLPPSHPAPVAPEAARVAPAEPAAPTTPPERDRAQRHDPRLPRGLPVRPLPNPNPVDPDGAVEIVTPPPLAGFGEHTLVRVDGWPSRIITADVDGNGALDIVYTSLLSHGKTLIAALIGDGKGGFETGPSVTVTDMVTQIAVADLDRDGDGDLVVAEYRNQRLAIYTSFSDGDVDEPEHVATRGKPTSVLAADLNGDSKIDLLANSLYKLQVFLGDGKGGVRALTAFAVGQAPDGPVVADVTGDGRKDLMFVLNDKNEFIALRGKGDGTFESLFSDESCPSPSYIRGGDFDGDGVTDAAYVCGQVHLRLARDKGTTFETVILDQAHGANHVTVGDFDADGHVDLLSVGSDLVVYAGDGKGSFDPECQGSSQGNIQPLGDPLAADLDRDGRTDLFAIHWTGREPGHVILWTGLCQP
jgi:hypothetical protein